MDYLPEDDSPFKEDLEPIIQTLETDPDWNKRFGAASKLFRLGKEKSVNPLIKAVQNDSHNEVRRFAIDLLGRLGDSRATWALIAALRQALIDKDTTIAHHTREALLKIKGSDLPSILTSTIDDEEEFFEMRISALDMLGKLADTKCVESLIKVINNPNTDGRIRGRAIEELVETGHLSGLQLILELLDIASNKVFQKVVVRAIGNTPFKNKTIVMRIGESLLKIMDFEESKGKKKDIELTKLVSEALEQLAENIEINFNEFIDELVSIRKKQQGK
ncbi:MAG: HEAT repeat domain-containing protein [Candidatus Heimdallarchaeota archaeon]|nr:HEAT repeat domain-containing protein [Candidatus Heimdallarchaeota archaeon]